MRWQFKFMEFDIVILYMLDIFAFHFVSLVNAVGLLRALRKCVVVKENGMRFNDQKEKGQLPRA